MFGLIGSDKDLEKVMIRLFVHKIFEIADVMVNMKPKHPFVVQNTSSIRCFKMCILSSM